MKKVFLFMITLFSTVVFAQENNVFSDFDVNKNFVYLYGGIVDYFDSNAVGGRILKDKYIDLGTKQYANEKVQFLKNGTAFFANVKGVDSCHDFAERITKGRINVYEYTSEVYTYTPAVGTGFGGFGGVGFGSTSQKKNQFYNIGFGLVKKVSYENLVTDLVDNQESMLHLQKYKKSRTTQVLLHVLATAAMFGGILTASEGTGEEQTVFDPQQGFVTEEKQNIKGVNLAIGLAGLATNVITYFAFKNKRKHITKAIDVYNGIKYE